jgi:hypothetical protein
MPPFEEMARTPVVYRVPGIERVWHDHPALLGG